MPMYEVDFVRVVKETFVFEDLFETPEEAREYVLALSERKLGNPESREVLSVEVRIVEKEA